MLSPNEYSCFLEGEKKVVSRKIYKTVNVGGKWEVKLGASDGDFIKSLSVDVECKIELYIGSVYFGVVKSGDFEYPIPKTLIIFNDIVFRFDRFVDEVCFEYYDVRDDTKKRLANGMLLYIEGVLVRVEMGMAARVSC